MESKHTPEPWKLRKIHNAGGHEIGITNDIIGSETIHANGQQYKNASSRSFSDTVCVIHGNLDLEGPKANADLIAAAPETKKQRDALLEACKRFDEYMNSEKQWPKGTFGILCDAIKAAISAAGGVE